ncbi:hypothetical protein [uncultured Algoriphagus sp.]|uniref:hypothetical protein n=1 Tax=uncultured Algoriphagus sp. TaxID=417365 RepID=UPI002599BA4A|nr:hypothetical protein [uncultured Algoriphagus sp.]
MIILSLKHSEGTKPCFWRPDDAGYTTIPWSAGIYKKDHVEANPKYYNNGYDTLAVEFSNEGLESIGFRCSMDLKKVKELSRQVKIQRGKDEEVSNG